MATNPDRPPVSDYSIPVAIFMGALAAFFATLGAVLQMHDHPVPEYIVVAVSTTIGAVGGALGARKG